MKAGEKAHTTPFGNDASSRSWKSIVVHFDTVLCSSKVLLATLCSPVFSCNGSRGVGIKIRTNGAVPKEGWVTPDARPHGPVFFEAQVDDVRSSSIPGRSDLAQEILSMRLQLGTEVELHV